MLVVRPISITDYPALHGLAVESGHGFTSLPVNEALLQQKIARSVAAFQTIPSQATDSSYLFVLEDTQSQKVVGISGIEGAVGLADSFYHYHLSKVVHASRRLKVYNEVELLTLCNDYTGQTEICTLFLLADYRKAYAGKLLSKVRFLFMAEHRQGFAQRVFAEMRGVSDDKGQSPFWQWLEKHFFTLDFPTADYLSGIGQKEFISELMPKYPIYVNLLSADAQAVIGKVHDKTQPALALLEKEGFRWRGYVDIFDGGPTVENELENINSIKQSRKLSVEIAEPQSNKVILVCNTKFSDFRALVVESEVDSVSQKIRLSAAQADYLLVKPDDSVRVLTIA
ncbi:arginine N-succinyltransferase [Saccharobesus litoralis]|uniref:Arginine N-succinyltransferase n=1 Tax=Saccharobesus litoralis TaxID=2172099 RepID=A0A2S0VW33_9ALTE|nr:arginine N-succinyltransferase [Saccharobesus litoralis]AWB68382.1 arginine N-succinyltransferase [Saccharobesus litoralis]